jgi:putative flippase GtrA
MEPEVANVSLGRGKSMIRWFIAGLLFMGINTLILYLLVRWIGLTVAVATLISAEICTLLRFELNERWVFGLKKQSWIRLWQYHLANGGAFLIWWLGTNVLTNAGVNYLVASIAAVALSTGLSLATNFLWIWRSRERTKA